MQPLEPERKESVNECKQGPAQHERTSILSVLASPQYSFPAAWSMASPLGQPRDVLSSTSRSDPSRLALSIWGRSPQSVQYMKLEEHRGRVVRNVYV